MGTKTNWRFVVEESVPIIQRFVDRGIIPTLRTVYYALVSKGLIPNTKSAYKRLSTVFVDARKNSVIKWSWIADDTRETKGQDNPLWEPKEFAERYVEYFFDAIENFRLPRWKDQPNYVEVWLEKVALSRTFLKFLDDRNVVIVPSRGYSSWSFLKDAAARLYKVRDRKCHILYFGDFDPSGQDIERFLVEALEWWGINVEVSRVAVDREQIEKYELPSAPEDAEEIEKLQRDPRYKNWEHGLFRVELDALLAFVPDEFERIIKESVDDLFDEGIHDEVLMDEAEKRQIAQEEAYRLIDERRENE